MFHSSPLAFRKTKNMPRDYYERQLTGTGRYRLRDVSHRKLIDMFKSLRRRRLHRNLSHRSLTHSLGLPPPFANHDSPAQPPLPDLSTSPSPHLSCYRFDAANNLGVTEEDFSPGMNTSSGSTPPSTKQNHSVSVHPVPTFPTSPSVFQLRSASTKDYLVERLEQHLRRLNLDDADPERVALSKSLSRDIPMDVCTSSRRALSDEDVQKPKSPRRTQNVVPTILITSVDAKHAKPLPRSTQRPSRTPFDPSNHLTNVPFAQSQPKTRVDDPFTTRPHDGAACPPDYNLTFRLPSFPSACPSLTQYAPETPTPICCDHFGDCRGDLWEILHPPLVAGAFTLPPFKLPPLSTELFDDVST